MNAMWDRLQNLQLGDLELVSVVPLVALVLLFRFLPHDRRRNALPPIVFLLAALATSLVRSTLMPDGAMGAALSLLVLLLLALGITGFLAVLTFDVAFRRARVPAILRDVLQAIVIFILIMIVLRRSGVDLLSLLTTSAVLTAVVGLALQSTIANLFAGLALPVERALVIGDWIKVGDHVGRIVEIKWRATRLVTKDGDSVLIPNGELIATDVVNYSKPTGRHRVWVAVGFHYRHPPNEIRRMLVEAARDVPGVRHDPPPDSFPTEFADSSVNYAVRFWIDDFRRDVEIAGEVRARIWYAAARHGIEIPFPIRTVIDASPSAEQLASRAAEEAVARRAAIEAVDLFAGLEAGDREMLARAVGQARFGRGETIIRQGDPGDSLYVIARGEVSVHVAVERVEREIARLRAGDFFGEMSLMTGEPRQASCTAATDVEAYVVDHDEMRALLEAKPKIAGQMCAAIASRQAELDGQREGLTAEARARRVAETRSRVLTRVRSFFQLKGPAEPPEIPRARH
jgi:small-conductance mechanosensitive channel/CRP-like cAMP-binding protein